MVKIQSIFLLVVILGTTYGKVDPPNFNFELKNLQVFYPGKSLKELQKKYGKGKQVKEANGLLQLRFYLQHLRYRFPILVQVKEDKITDFFATLPSYFLHDTFHQALINSLGTQDEYLLKDAHAIYRWNKKDGFIHTYVGACSITCHPIYYAVKAKGLGKTHKSLLQQLDALNL